MVNIYLKPVICTLLNLKFIYLFVFLSDFFEKISQKQSGIFGKTRPDDAIGHGRDRLIVTIELMIVQQIDETKRCRAHRRRKYRLTLLHFISRVRGIYFHVFFVSLKLSSIKRLEFHFLIRTFKTRNQISPHEKNRNIFKLTKKNYIINIYQCRHFFFQN